ncbi:putative selection and upkeep of intraepithelial T-cells protein 1 homolog isoform X2 [Centroberyx affinis]|uniref:putative selection and upkeep of intraepithelial T-cells protein 1 homolog isoform X2 n=1 Tax=Centroberyx affinis TaxID=166261 RepID=UPI003A5C0578
MNLLEIVTRSMITTRLLWLWLVPVAGLAFGQGSGSELTTVFAKEGEPAILPCLHPTRMNLEREFFDLKRGDQEVFFHDIDGSHYNNGRSGQDEQFKGRVWHFPEELKNGNASLLFNNPKVSDTGNYSCVFLQPNRQTFYIWFRVYAAPQPRTAIVDRVEKGVLLKCSTRGASPQPELEWRDSDGNVVPAEKPKISRDSEGRYNIELYAAVTKTKTNDFRCIAKQTSIGHMIHDDIHVPDQMFHDDEWRVWLAGVLGWFIGFATLAVLLAVLSAAKCIKISWTKDSSRQKATPLAREDSTDD